MSEGRLFVRHNMVYPQIRTILSMFSRKSEWINIKQNVCTQNWKRLVMQVARLWHQKLCVPLISQKIKWVPLLKIGFFFFLNGKPLRKIIKNPQIFYAKTLRKTTINFNPRQTLYSRRYFKFLNLHLWNSSISLSVQKNSTESLISSNRSHSNKFFHT